MHLDAASDKPMFLQIAGGVRDAIAAGVHKVGEPVPSVRVQAQRLRINPNTIQRAYEELQREGVLEARAGLGLFVAPGALRAAQDASRDAVRDALLSAIKAAQRAGMSTRELELAFEEARRLAPSAQPGDNSAPHPAAERTKSTGVRA
jgi:DNA-binding transcriptional regulator YhcF (GntR family)